VVLISRMLTSLPRPRKWRKWTSQAGLRLRMACLAKSECGGLAIKVNKSTICILVPDFRKRLLDTSHRFTRPLDGNKKGAAYCRQ